MSLAARPRIGGLPVGGYPWYVRLILRLQRKKYARELGPALIRGRIPSAFLMLALPYRSLDRGTSPLEPGLRALVQVRVSQINRCAFCVDLNSTYLCSTMARAVVVRRFT